MKKILMFAFLLLVFFNCATQRNLKTNKFVECTEKCVDLSVAEDKEGVTNSYYGRFYLIYVCGYACKDYASPKDWEDFQNWFKETEKTIQ